MSTKNWWQFKMRVALLFCVTATIILATVLIGYATGNAVSNSSGCSYFGQCPQMCDKNGDCSCLDGFKIGQSDRSCVPVDSSWKVLYTSIDKIGYVDRDATGMAKKSILFQGDIIPNTTWRAGVTFDARNRVAYWINNKLQPEGIYRTSFDQPGKAEVVFQNSSYFHPSALAFDWITGNIYATDATGRNIVVCRNDSINFCGVLVKLQRRVNSMALHPNLGIMFWTSFRPFNISVNLFGSSTVKKANSSCIVRAGMDGGNVHCIVNNVMMQLALQWTRAMQEFTGWSLGSPPLQFSRRRLMEMTEKSYFGAIRKGILRSVLTLTYSGTDCFGANHLLTGLRYLMLNGDKLTLSKFCFFNLFF